MLSPGSSSNEAERREREGAMCECCEMVNPHWELL